MTLPRTMRDAVRAEFGRALRPPYETPGVVVMNGLLMTACWLLLPRSWFFDFTGTMAFPIILAGWMYADVPATNVFAPDRRRILAAFDDGRELRLLLFAKNAVLWLFVTPLCIAIAIGLGAAEHQATVTALSIVVIALAPLGVLGLSGILGTYFPYHPLPLRWRWEHRSNRRMLMRWGTLVLLPYVLVPGAGGRRPRADARDLEQAVRQGHQEAERRRLRDRRTDRMRGRRRPLDHRPPRRRQARTPPRIAANCVSRGPGARVTSRT